MKTPIASIFIAILAVTTGAEAQDAKNQPKPRPAPTQPATVPLAVNNPPSARMVNDATVPPSPQEQERLERLGGQPLLWLKTMAAHHESSRKIQGAASNGGGSPAQARSTSPSTSSTKAVKRKKAPKKTSAKAR
ncbi:MAG: hypothetical protein RLZZ495_825 [Pseudomonadota bacterium]|jgi:hypothetical protein